MVLKHCILHIVNSESILRYYDRREKMLITTQLYIYIQNFENLNSVKNLSILLIIRQSYSMYIRCINIL